MPRPLIPAHIPARSGRCSRLRHGLCQLSSLRARRLGKAPFGRLVQPVRKIDDSSLFVRMLRVSSAGTRERRACGDADARVRKVESEKPGNDLPEEEVRAQDTQSRTCDFGRDDNRAGGACGMRRRRRTSRYIWYGQSSGKTVLSIRSHRPTQKRFAKRSPARDSKKGKSCSLRSGRRRA